MTLETYIDAGLTTYSSDFQTDSVIYITNGMATTRATTNTVLALTVQSLNPSGTPITLSTATHSFASNSNTTLAVAMGGTQALTASAHTLSAGDYLLQLTVTDTELGNAQYDYGQFVIVAVLAEPTITGISASPTTASWGDNLTVSCNFAVMPGSGAWVEVRKGGASIRTYQMSTPSTVGTAVVSTYDTGPGTFSVVIDAINLTSAASETASNLFTVSAGSGIQYTARTELYNKLCVLTASGQLLAGFEVNKEFPNHRTLAKRAVTILEAAEPTFAYGYGGLTMPTLPMNLQITFDEDFTITASGHVYTRQELSDYVLEKARSALGSTLDFQTAGVNLVGRPVIVGASHREYFEDDDQTVFGSVITVNIPYKET